MVSIDRRKIHTDSDVENPVEPWQSVADYPTREEARAALELELKQFDLSGAEQPDGHADRYWGRNNREGLVRWEYRITEPGRNP
jgi:hypothetical protein